MAESQRYNTPEVEDSLFDAATSYGSIEQMKEQEELEKSESGKLAYAGIAAVAAGSALFLVNQLVWLAGLIGISDAAAMPFLQGMLPAIGFGAIGYGLIKALRLTFRNKQLDFPMLELQRKRVQTASAQVNAGNRARTANSYDEAYENTRPDYRRSKSTQRSNKLRKSRRNRVFSGVAAGISEYTGVSAGLIRMGFIIGMFFSGGMITFAYLLLSIVLPSSYDDDWQRR